MPDTNLKPEKWYLLGAGYAGLSFASRWTSLVKNHSEEGTILPQLTLINAASHSDCTCELYRVLRSGKQEYFHVPKVLNTKIVNFLEGRLFQVDPSKKTFSIRSTEVKSFSYDRLIFAAGAGVVGTKIKGVEDQVKNQSPIAPRVFGLRSNQQVLSLRMALQRVGWTKASKKETFVVVIGGGPTGVELAGEMAALRGKNPKKRIIVIEKSYDPLRGVLGILGNKVLKSQLKKLGVEYFEGGGVSSVDSKFVHIDNGQIIPWNLLVLANGSQVNKDLFSMFSEEIWSQDDRIKVDRSFQIEDSPGHYAIGDLSYYSFLEEADPQTAQVAVQQGFFLAERLFSEFVKSYNAPSVFQKSDWGYLVSLGPKNGAGRLGPVTPVWGKGVDFAKKAAKLRFDAQLKTGWKLSP